MNLLDIIITPAFFYSVLRVTTPILFAALAALVSNKASMINVGIEGTMSFSALLGVIVSALTQSLLLGFLAAIITGICYSLLLGFLALRMKTHLFLTGIALNLFATGGTVFLLYLVSNDKGTSVSLKSLVLPTVSIPLINNIPVIGGILSNHNILSYCAFIMVFVLWFFFKHTKLGIRIRAAGENEKALATVGVNVRRIKYIALGISGLLSGMGGAYMSMGYVSFYSANMIAGRGFIGIAAEAMGKGRPVGVMLASLIFGFFDTLANSLQMTQIPIEFVQMLPYVVTVFLFTLYAAQEKYRRSRLALAKKS